MDEIQVYECRLPTAGIQPSLALLQNKFLKKYNTMFEFLFTGGILFMSILTAMLIINICLIGFFTFKSFNNNLERNWNTDQLNFVKYIGILALTIGLFGQIIGLYSAFESIEKVGDVSPGIFAGGLRVSSYTTIYGFSIFLISYLSWLILKAIASKQLSIE